jgi:DNA polymerase-3 subunit beta
MKMTKAQKAVIKLASTRQILHILKNVRVSGGVMSSTNTDLWLYAPCDLPDGLYTTQSLNTAEIVMPVPITNENIDDYPVCPSDYGITPPHSITLDIAGVQSLKNIALACSVKDFRQYLNGVFFELSTGNLVATDEYRLHVKQCVVLIDTAESVVMPTDLISIITSSKGASVSFYPQWIEVVTADGLTARTKAVDGRFPDYRRVLPDYRESTAFPKLLDAIAAIKVVVKELKRGSKVVSALFDGENLVVGSATNRFAFPLGAPAPVKTAFNVDYLLNILECTGADSQFFFGDAGNSLLVCGNGYKCVVMSVRI